MRSTTGHKTGFAEVTSDERAQLVRLCDRFVGDREVAEDLAQEALLEAWRNGHKLRDPGARAWWLAGIARNVCRRWLRAAGGERAHLARSITFKVSEDHDTASILDLLPDNVDDIELQLERDELATLLDRALALLPTTTRDVLIAHYIRESPHAETAARLGVHEGAIKMRLRRGKLALRRVLTTELREEAIAYGLVAPINDMWEETRIWCPLCGGRRLLGRLHPNAGEFALTCPDCAPRYGVRNAHPLGSAWFDHVFGGVAAYRPALTRLMIWVDAYYRPALGGGTLACEGCGQPIPLRHQPPPEYAALLPSLRGVHAHCDHCRLTTDVHLSNLALYLPEVRRFWRDHPRLRTLPERAIEADGRPALVLGFASVTDGARLDVVVARDTYATLAIHGHVDA